MNQRRPHLGLFGNQRAWPKRLTREERLKRVARNMRRQRGWEMVSTDVDISGVRFVGVPPKQWPHHKEGVARLKTLFVVG